MKRWLVWSIGAALSGGLIFMWFQPRQASPETSTLSEITRLKPEAFMEGVRQRTFDKEGTLESTLIADSLLDFGERADAELKRPRIWLNHAPVTWFLTGKTGTLSADRTQVHFQTEVSAIRSEPGSEPWQLFSDSVFWDQASEVITSDSTTQLTRGAVQSVGDSLIMNLRTSEYTLGNKVRTQWQTNSSSPSP